MPSVVVTGSTGQTGSYLVEKLLTDGWEVHGISAHSLKEQESINHLLDISDSEQFSRLLSDINPDAIVNLAAISNVSSSWSDPIQTTSVNCISTATCLDYVHNRLNKDKYVKFVQASSALIFDSSSGLPLNEHSRLSANNPYAASKLFGHVLTQSFRKAGCLASNAILFNHESPRRPPTFVTRKISQAVAKITLGIQSELVLGPLDIHRDWGWAPDYADALLLMLNSNSAADYVIATGESHSIKDFLDIAFSYVGIPDWTTLVRSESSLQRPTDEPVVIGDSSKIENELGWKRTISFTELVQAMVENDLELTRSETVK